MLFYSNVSFAAEAVLLGLASGPACLASCGPVLLPWLAAEADGVRGATSRLAVFLGGRLGGYLLFAVGAWALGVAVPVDSHARTLVFGLANLGLAAMLGLSAWRPRGSCRNNAQRANALVQVGEPGRTRPPLALALGFFTGLNLCPPFVAASVRAVETRSLAGALTFFLLFFGGTTVWFVPAVAVSAARRIAEVATVARMTMALLAAYYAYLGAMSVSWGILHAQ